MNSSNGKKNYEADSNTRSGFSLFAVIGIVWAAITSWSITPSVGWTILHAMFGWFYLILHWCGVHTSP